VTIALAQTWPDPSSSTGSGTSAIVTGPVTTAGSLITCRVTTRTAGALLTLSDDAGNTWVEVAHASHGAGDQWLFYAEGTAPLTQITVSSDVSVNKLVFVSEWSGAATSGALVASNSQTLASATDNPAVQVTPTIDGCLIFGTAGSAVTNRTYTQMTPGFTDQTTLKTGQMTSLAAYLIQGTASTIGPEWDITSGSAAGLGQITAAFQPAGGGGTDVTSPATTGSQGFSGLRAASAAGILAATALAGLSWSGMPASSGATRTDVAAAGAATWQGLRATSASDVVHTTSSPGAITLAGAAPSLLFEDVVTGTGPAATSWDGITATSTADTLTVADVAASAWSGLAATSNAAAAGADLATTAALAWSGHAATSTTGILDTATPAAGSWSGAPATSASGIVDDARAATSSWSGLAATSTSGAATNTTPAALSLAGLTAVSVTGTTSPTDVPTLAWSGLQASSFAVDPDVVAPPERTLTIAAEDRTLVVAAEDRTLTIT
jgi:hypothetical protein